MPFHRFETALGHLRGQDLQRLGVSETAGQGLGNQPCIHAGTLRQGHHFGNHQGIAGDNHLVAGLGDLACPHSPHVRDPLPQGQQHWANPFDIRRLTAHHDRQAAGLGTGGSTGNRGIDPGHAGVASQHRGHLPGGGGFQAGQVQQQLPGPGALGDAIGSKHHLAHHVSVGQAQQHQIRVLAQLRGCGHLSRPGGHQGRALLRIAVPHRQRIARSQQAPAHGQPHQADPGKPE
ncbi:hypothetical protein BK642_23565 [Pseudomonas protegens]|nr:hypothetical protein BK639_24800 [Pseudomonas protegens]ROM02298.1 hypothetical protein BK641_17660 [Pseudomonas protegens]ROM04673.1 hypothetical protein BK642_23565 [Pseudomonas protegens]